MGVFEYLRKEIAKITGKDPEETDSSPLYKFYSQETRGQMGVPTRGTVPFKHSVASPQQLPPGFAYDYTGKVVDPHMYDATMGDAIRVLPMYGAGSAQPHGALIYNIAMASPELTLGPAVASPQSTAFAFDEWKWGRVAITLGAAGATADTQLVAAVAGKKIQLAVIGLAYVAKVDSAANSCPIFTIQDSDNVTLSGAAVIAMGTSFCNVVGAAQGNDLPHREWDLMRGPVCYSATANLAIEADVAGGIQNDIVEIIYAWREFA